MIRLCVLYVERMGHSNPVGTAPLRQWSHYNEKIMVKVTVIVTIGNIHKSLFSVKCSVEDENVADTV